MLNPTTLTEMFRLHRMSVMKQRRKSREHQDQAPDIDAIRHAEWRAANYQHQEMSERNRLVHLRHLEAHERIADALEKLLAAKV